MNEKFKYKNLCDKYDMTGDIKVGTGTLKVHDIFNPIPDFMREADVMFCDAPCSKANLNSFYTKAEKKFKCESFEPFNIRFWQVVDEISPKRLFLEVFKSNKNRFLDECKKRFFNIEVYDSMYYNKPANKCWIIQASNEPLIDMSILNGVDEELFIEYVCTKTEYSCIGDPCIGKGLVAFYANKAGKKFVGTELSKYRLAVAIERVTTNCRGKIK